MQFSPWFGAGLGIGVLVSAAWLADFGRCAAGEPGPDDFARRLAEAPARIVGTDGKPLGEGLRLDRRWEGPLCTASLTNTSAAPVRIKEVAPFELAHGLPGDTPLYAEAFQMLAQNGGTLARPADLGSLPDRSHYRIPEPQGFRSAYGMLLLSPAGRPRTLLGFASCRKFNGRFDYNGQTLRVVMDTEGLELPPGQTWEFEPLGVWTGTDREALLDNLTDAVAKHHPRIAREPVPTGWCSWYCFGPSVTAADVTANLDWMAQNLPQVRYVQLDDGYQPFMGDWLDTGKGFGGTSVRDLMGQIKQRGFEPAIWVAPFIAERKSRLFKEHPDWFVKDAAGRPLDSSKVGFGGWRCGPWYVLDGTHPEVQAHLEKLFRTMRREWGVTYFKLDANYWGALHGGRRHDPAATRIEAYRRGMAAILRGAGDAFILGCNHPIWPSLGLIHGSRSSNDVGRSWGSFRQIGRENLLRAWQNGRFWWNDPDCVLLSGKQPDSEFLFHAALMHATGGMMLSGDDLPKLSPPRLAILKKLFPPAGRPARFDSEAFEIGRLPVGDALHYCLLNWTDRPVTRSIPLERPARLRDYFSGEDLGRREGEFRVELPPRSGRVIAAAGTN